MKRWTFYLAALVILLLLQCTPFHGTDLAKLLPTELIRVSYAEGEIRIETESGYYGTGDTVADALRDLEDTTPGTVFLQTADFLVVDPDSIYIVDQIAPHLRPACGICKGGALEDLEAAAAFLGAHVPNISIQDWISGKRELPILLLKDGRMQLVQGKD